MAEQIVRTVDYELDIGETVQIQIRYENFNNPTADTRFRDGDFGDQDITGCAVILNRRKLKPRYIIKEYTVGQDKILQRVYVKNLTKYNTLITESTTKRYSGEEYCPNNP